MKLVITVDAEDLEKTEEELFKLCHKISKCLKKYGDVRTIEINKESN